MKIDPPESLLLVFDSSKAKFYRLSPSGKVVLLNEIQSGLPRSNQDIVTDRPTRSFSSVSPRRGSGDYKSDPHNVEKHNFVHELAELLDTSYDRNEFRSLVVAAPERSIGELRKLLPEKIKRTIRHEILKELLHYPDQEIETRLRPLIGL